MEDTYDTEKANIDIREAPTKHGNLGIKSYASLSSNSGNDLGSKASLPLGLFQYVFSLCINAPRPTLFRHAVFDLQEDIPGETIQLEYSPKALDLSEW